ncbi:MAG: excalibur calcium-binding domain-containing protein [Pseudomonadota bacterium]
MPWPVEVGPRHVLVAPNGAAARVVGLAPAARGEPRYHRKQDCDQDGWARERWQAPR